MLGGAGGERWVQKTCTMDKSTEAPCAQPYVCVCVFEWVGGRNKGEGGRGLTDPPSNPLGKGIFELWMLLQSQG